ncbi:ABC-2 type transport system ATP-binding protein [Kribbella orskensis]|uniref:ABC-2 type transport system ATP-binding protein n=2 Tax=Kribbellaceae TaxID=2726069 RepID=A0ABY2BNC9_9ACTN|nr:ABC-2 type transport system ATP-binding protein [Kribbella sp. VKM Ac-2500]TCO25727.1 ABC-2 type transport system ATP-binding protein [Kribbella orskensis]
MTYRAAVREAGLRAALRSVVKREYRDIEAVAEVSFELRAGEVVGFIGPNGAGKTTTMKILSGILHPTVGEARVLGFVPWRRQHDYLKKIALVRGSQPIGGPAELTVMDSLRYQQLLYEVSHADFRANVAELVGMLDLESLLDRQVRALSLGERMRAGLATTLVYRPKVLFLDEPTLGLDVSAAAALRRFVAEYAVRTGATVLLTSHYMADVASLCRRVILIDRSRVRYDGDLNSLATTLSPYKLIKLSMPDRTGIDWERFGELDTTQDLEQEQVSLRVRREAVPEVTSELLRQLAIVDLTVEDPPLDLVIDQFYQAGRR